MQTKTTPRARRFAVAFAIAAACCAPALAGPLEDGIAAYREKDYTNAAGMWRPLAEGGNAKAQQLLGTLYAEGKGVAPNSETAFQWFQRAASQGDPVAQYQVGASYASGTGVKKDNAEAAKWFQKAAEQGMAYAQLNLGLLYAAGNGVPQDNIEAFKWLEVAFFALPAGGPRSDVARAMTDVSANMTREQIDEAQRRERGWKAQAAPK